MSIASRIEQIEQHLTDNYSILTLGGADLTNVDKNIQNLKTQWKSRLEYYLANGLDVVWDNWNKVSASGTTLSINNTIQAPMKIVYGGNTYQESTTGKQLLKYPYAYTSNSPYTNFDVTWTDNGDGSVTANGTPSGASVFALSNTNNFKIEVEPSTTYTISGGNTTKGVVLSLIEYDNNGNLLVNHNNITTEIFTTNSSTKMVEIALKRYSNNVRIDNFRVYPMLELGSIAHDFEKYSGGSPAPSPSFPYPVQVVSGNNSIKVEGKNLFNHNNTQNAYIDASYVVQSNANNIITDYIQIKSNTNYYCSVETPILSIGYIIYDKTKTPLSRTGSVSMSSKVATISHNFNDDYGYVRIWFNVDNASLNINRLLTYKPMFTNLLNTTYQPYESATYPINLGSIELCKIGDYQDYIYKQNGNWYKYGAIGKYIANSDLADNGYTNYYVSLLTPILNVGASIDDTDFASMSMCNLMATKYDRQNTNYSGLVGTSATKKIRVYLSKNIASTFNEAQTFLTNNNLTIYYVLNTPTTTQITDQTLIGQLENIKKAVSYDTQTNISQTNNDMPFELDINALESM